MMLSGLLRAVLCKQMYCTVFVWQSFFLSLSCFWMKMMFYISITELYFLFCIVCCLHQESAREKSCAFASRIAWWCLINGVTALLNHLWSLSPATQTVNSGTNPPSIMSQTFSVVLLSRNYVSSSAWTFLYFYLQVACCSQDRMHSHMWTGLPKVRHLLHQTEQIGWKDPKDWWPLLQ